MEAKIRKLQEFYWSDADPDGRGFVNLADAYRKDGNPTEALRILREGLRRHPELPSGHVVAGWIYLDQGDSMDAEAAFRAALEVDSQNTAALRGLGEVLALGEDTQGALDALRRLMPLDPLDGELRGRVEALETKVHVPDVVVAEDPSPPEDPPAQSLWEDPEEAAEELDWESAALQEDQSRVEGEAEGAPEFVAEVDSPVGAFPVARDEDDALVTRTMGAIFLRQGLLDEAEGVFEQLLERDPESQELRARLEEVRARKRGEIPGESGALRPVGRFGQGVGPDVVVPIQTLVVEGVVPIGDLAPELILPIADLAPDLIVPIAALAPGPASGDPRLDSFEAWLDEHP